MCIPKDLNQFLYTTQMVILDLFPKTKNLKWGVEEQKDAN
jgi:hypothetical protein